ncbi:MAG: tetratricopeptide repeat protein, partial [Acidobacteriota bacterium]|nr:tetratricopeptide repeat protein [Acidobacteriota bacterium]
VPMSGDTARKSACATWLLAFTLQASPFVERRIASARELIQKNKNDSRGYNDLAMALAKRFRETGDPAYLKQSEEALGKSFRLAPTNFEGRKARVFIRLQERRFADALEEAQALNKQTPDDNTIYGFIADAQIALGNYPEADAATQRMLDMHRVNAPALQRGAELREVYGDFDGAREWWNSALRLTSASDTEERAWIATHLALVDLHAGKPDGADTILEEALKREPDYPEAIEALARVRMVQNRAADAVELLRKRGNSYLLAQALEKSGHPDEAKRMYALLDNRDLIRYYSNEGGNPKEAVRLARLEVQKRHDIFTLDALAWALYRNGETEEARQRIGEALAVGTKDPGILAHAMEIRGQATNAP